MIGKPSLYANERATLQSLYANERARLLPRHWLVILMRFCIGFLIVIWWHRQWTFLNFFFGCSWWNWAVFEKWYTKWTVCIADLLCCSSRYGFGKSAKVSDVYISIYVLYIYLFVRVSFQYLLIYWSVYFCLFVKFSLFLLLFVFGILMQFVVPLGKSNASLKSVENWEMQSLRMILTIILLLFLCIDGHVWHHESLFVSIFVLPWKVNVRHCEL